jgi:hypothetical protein
MFQLKTLNQIIVASCAFPLLAACGSGEQPDETRSTIEDSNVATAAIEAAPARSAETEVAATPSTAPGTDERTALIAQFRDQASNHCAFYKESIESSPTGDLKGARIQMCSGKFSQTENFGLITNLEGGPFAPGTVLATMGANGEPGAFDPLFILIGELAQMNEAEVNQLRQEMPLKLRFAGNLFSVDYAPLMTTRSGVQLSVAGNMFQPDSLTIKIDPPR